jgi:predicted RNase H-like nuclease (RuvC/YqgF family)
MKEFIEPTTPSPTADAPLAAPPAETDGEDVPPELDVQKAVVEELAAEKVELHEQIAARDAELAALKEQLSGANQTIAILKSENARLCAQAEELQVKLDTRLAHELDQQQRNPNSLALLDREVELPDRFPGETRDHVLEVIAAARDAAEQEGRVRRAQVLEAVLVANEPSGALAARRAEITKLFSENGNIVNGTVLARLQELGISHKNGDDYLLPSEIIKRAF